MRNRGLWDAYVEGVVTFVNYDAPGTGDPEFGLSTGREEHEAARVQGYYDAKAKRVMSRTEFDREKLMRRVEVRESSS
jgi:hypothetical protein